MLPEKPKQEFVGDGRGSLFTVLGLSLLKTHVSNMLSPFCF
jgi:hypothetical protein